MSDNLNSMPGPYKQTSMHLCRVERPFSDPLSSAALTDSEAVVCLSLHSPPWIPIKQPKVKRLYLVTSSQTLTDSTSL